VSKRWQFDFVSVLTVLAALLLLWLSMLPDSSMQRILTSPDLPETREPNR